MTKKTFAFRISKEVSESDLPHFDVSYESYDQVATWKSDGKPLIAYTSYFVNCTNSSYSYRRCSQAPGVCSEESSAGAPWNQVCDEIVQED